MSDDNYPAIAAPRLRGYNYSLPGAYFITICTHERKLLLGAVDSDLVELSALGMLAQQGLAALSSIDQRFVPSSSVVMPNHVHLLLELRGTNALARPSRSGTASSSVASAVQAFKSMVTRIARRQVGYSGALWQPGYYDHVVRTDAALEKVQEYIANNPLAWHLDRENPQRIGASDFYQWLERESHHSG